MGDIFPFQVCLQVCLKKTEGETETDRLSSSWPSYRVG